MGRLSMIRFGAIRYIIQLNKMSLLKVWANMQKKNVWNSFSLCICIVLCRKETGSTKLVAIYLCGLREKCFREMYTYPIDLAQCSFQEQTGTIIITIIVKGTTW